jgi:rod shape determining protein RodA
VIIDHNSNNLIKRLEGLNWLMISLIIMLAFVGFLMLYSAGGGSYRPWMIKQLIYFAIFFPIMIFIAITDIKIWFKYSYAIYVAGLILLLIVAISGHNAMGATRWFRVGAINIQPSEIMKICTVFALARYFYNIEVEDIGKIKTIAMPLLLIMMPAFLIFKQPDLGTSAILIIIGASVLFMAGIRAWKFISVGVIALIAIPFAWNFWLYDYQKQRVLTFLNPDKDPLGSGYNIIQSKIAIGSGGLFGKGYLNGTQGQLNFLPEKQTDFIFTMLAEEMGFAGGFTLILIYLIITILCYNIALKTKHQYGKLLVMGILNIFFIHMFINIGMVAGMMPVVGVPLPFISYGGTIMAAMMIGFGLILNVDLYKNAQLKSSGHLFGRNIG